MSFPSIQNLKAKFPEISNLALLDKGGQKTVYSGTHSTYQDVVLKLTSMLDERTLREVQILKTKQLSGVPKLFESGQKNFDNTDILYLIEEKVVGKNFRQLLQEVDDIDFHKAFSLLGFLLESVVKFEQENLVHRDIKPENLMESYDGRFFILDFGIARVLDLESLTATATHFGPATLGYAAPEQYKNMKANISSRADLYSIGVVFYECITGKNPFIDGARGHLDIIKRSDNNQLDKLQLPEDKEGELADFIDILTQKYPSRRPQNAIQAFNWYQDIKKTLFKGER